MRRSEKAQKADVLVGWIGEMACQIQELEKELIGLLVTDVQEKYNPSFLWSWIQDKNVSMNISLSTSLENLIQACESYLFSVRNR